MEITKEEVVKEIESLKQQREQKQNDFVALGGAIQVYEFWLDKIEKSEKTGETSKAG